MKQLIECVPNFSEGRDKAKIDAIVAAISGAAPVEVLDVDPGEATNRTVVTFAGEPEAVLEAAFAGVRKAAELIDMRSHHGAHPRMGATDVLPLVPVSGITLEECAELARKLGKRIADELNIPVYAYEASALIPERKNLAVCRKGEYEGLAQRCADDAPDFGARPWDDDMARTGATAVGARDFLIAVNFNLNTVSTRRANAVAFDVREKGRPGKPGLCKGTKAIGWFIDEYGIAQVSMNITDISQTPLHVAFATVDECARKRGLRVTGTEIVGLVPLKTLIDAGKYFLAAQQRSWGIPDEEIIRIAVRSMGLDELRPFEPEEKIVEYVLAARQPEKKLLTGLTTVGFADKTASESPAPGGGSVGAYMGALAAALAAMVANLSAHKRGWDDRWREFSDVAVEARSIMKRLLELVDADTDAFNFVMDAMRLPAGNDEEKAARNIAIELANEHAARVPLETARAAIKAYPLLEKMIKKGNPASVTDAGTGAVAADAAINAAMLNVLVNAKSLTDSVIARMLVTEARDLADQSARLRRKLMRRVLKQL